MARHTQGSDGMTLWIAHPKPIGVTITLLAARSMLPLAVLIALAAVIGW